MTKEYIVKKGDTLWGIARQYAKTVAQLAEWNSLSSRQVHDLKIGQHILLSAKKEEEVPDLVVTINAQAQRALKSPQPTQTFVPLSAPLSASAGAGGANSWHDPLAHCVLRTAGLASAKAATFGMVRNNGLRAHQGMDLAANPGTTIYAVASGTVAAVNPNDVGDYGKHIIIEVNPDDLPACKRLYAIKTKDLNGDDIAHENHRIYFFYAHLSEIININVGNTINAGQSLGKTGNTGNANGMTEISKGAHLHFEARLVANTHRGLQQRIDPIPFLDAHLSY